MSTHIQPTDNPRVVIIGAGFAGLRLARKIAAKPYDVVLIDRNNFHQFQPLFYQVATAGLAPSSISFPIRKAFHDLKNVHFRMAEVLHLHLDEKEVETDIGRISYDHLVIATGTDTNYFQNKEIERHAFPMKSVQESLHLRNRILECMENALTCDDPDEMRAFMSIVVVGGGPTGTEVSGALSEMRNYVLPKDYPELDFDKMEIHLIEAAPKLLAAMSEASSSHSEKFLRSMGVQVRTQAMVESYDGHTVKIKGGDILHSKTLIWAAGVKGNVLPGIKKEWLVANSRIKVDAYNRLEHHPNVYVIGDLAYMEEPSFPKGHPQVAQVAIQQADRLFKNFEQERKGMPQKAFHYKDLGSMATIGRNKAVVDLPFFKFQGFMAWAFWLFVHLMAILGVKNKIFIFLEWMWNYITFDQSLRLVIKQKPRNNSEAS